MGQAFDRSVCTSEELSSSTQTSTLFKDIYASYSLQLSVCSQSCAGPMTAQDMVDLCSPPPFGEFRQSALHTALKAAPDLWSRLRNVDSDKEAAMLQVREPCLSLSTAAQQWHRPLPHHTLGIKLNQEGQLH